MISVEYPTYSFQTKNEKELTYIFDPFRKKWVVLTPEEWVRQNFLQYLHQSLQYPAALIAVERGLQLGELKKRFDILIFDKQQQPFIIVECKASHVQLSPATIQQALNYNITIPVPFIVITNGIQTFAFQKINNEIQPLLSIPMFE